MSLSRTILHHGRLGTLKLKIRYKFITCQWTTVVNLKMKNIPETIIVAAWSKALTGVGAAIASVSHPEKGNKADLLQGEITYEKEITVK